MEIERRKNGRQIFGGASRKILTGAFIFATTCVLAVTGYVLAGWDMVDAVYMVVITMYGVGYGEVQPVEGTTMKVFTIAVITIGCSSAIYVLGGVFQLIAEGEVERMMGERRLSSGIERQKDHTIICGYGRVGGILAAELKESDVPFVIIEKNEHRLNTAVALDYLVLMGDAEEESVLMKAGVMRAKTLATVLPDDATNVFITLTARELNSDLEIIARGENPTTERKLRRSGADSVVMPAALGAQHIAQLIV